MDRQNSAASAASCASDGILGALKEADIESIISPDSTHGIVPLISRCWEQWPLNLQLSVH